MNIKDFLEKVLDIREGVPFCIKERDENDYDIPDFYVYENDKIYNIDNKEQSDPEILSKILKGEVFVYRQPKNHIYELHNIFEMDYNKKYKLYKDGKFVCCIKLTRGGVCHEGSDAESSYLLEELCSPNSEIKPLYLPKKGQLYYFIDRDGKIKTRIFQNDAIDIALKNIDNVFSDEESANNSKNVILNILNKGEIS